MLAGVRRSVFRTNRVILTSLQGVLVDGVLLNTWVRIAATLLLVTAFVASCVAPSHK